MSVCIFGYFVVNINMASHFFLLTNVFCMCTLEDIMVCGCDILCVASAATITYYTPAACLFVCSYIVFISYIEFIYIVN